MTTLHTAFGKVRTGSTRPFIAVIAVPGETPRIHARAETRATLEKRLRREGFSIELSTGLFVKHARATVEAGVPTPGARLAAVEIVEGR